MQVEKYGSESCPDWLTDDYQEARAIALRDSPRVIAYAFTFEDSEVVDDFREGRRRNEVRKLH